MSNDEKPAGIGREIAEEASRETRPREPGQAERRIGTGSGGMSEETVSARYSTSGSIFHRFGVAAISLAGIDCRQIICPRGADVMIVVVNWP